jgi:putative nucleotidyltransferase with HDIG domain
MRRGKIVYSLLAVMLLLGVVPLLVASSKLIENSQTELRAAEIELQLDQTRSIRDQIRLYLQATQQQVVAIAKTFGGGGDAAQVAARIASVSSGQELIHYVGEDSHVVYIVVSDRDGRGGQAGPGGNLAPELQTYLQDSFVEAVKGNDYVSPPFVDRELLDTVMVLSTPILVSTGADRSTRYVAGVVSAVVSLRPIQEIVQGKTLEGRQVYVVGGNGLLVAHSDRKTLFTNGDFSGTPMVRAFQEARGLGSPSVPFTQSEGGVAKEMVGTHTSIGDRGSSTPLLRNLDWGAIVQAELEKVNSKVHQMQRTSYQIAGLSALLALGLGTVFAGQLSRPIARLAEGARRLATGDFSHQISVRSRNEIGELAETFNIMTAEIRNYIERLQKAALENKQMFMGAVSSLAAAIDAKDPYTRGHSERVANYAERIAQSMGLPEAEVERIRISALMHDVGKIGIEDKILGKAGPLTEEEYEIMKTHPVKGAVIMEQVPQLKEMIPGMKYHHENVDGTGYPEGLKGSQIPLAAKIVSVADTFDAMTTNRPYQKAMEISYVLERMRSFVGKKFDKPVVEALISAYEEGRIRVSPGQRKVVAIRPDRPERRETTPPVLGAGSTPQVAAGSKS